MRLLPRISVPEVDSLLVKYRGLSVETIAGKTDETKPWQDSWPTAPTGGYPVESADLEAWRRQIISIARACGYPGESGRSKQREFDRQVTRILWERLSQVAVGDLMRGETWAFLTTVLLPDVTLWRFSGQGNEKGMPVRRRYLGGHRNVFQRLWTRAFLLRQDHVDDPYHLVDALSEDELVGLLERPNISANPEIAQAIAGTLVAFDPEIKKVGLKREEVHRAAMLRIRARFPVIALDFLDGDELGAELDSAYRKALEALRAEMG